MKKSKMLNSLAGAIALALLSTTGPAFASSHNGVSTDTMAAGLFGDTLSETVVGQPTNSVSVKNSSSLADRVNVTLKSSRENAGSHEQSAQNEKSHKKSNEESPHKGAQQSSATQLQQVVVTGAQTFQGVTRARASFSITTATHAEIKRFNPISTAGVLSLSPGIFVQPEGGQDGGNVILAGFPSQAGEPFVTYEIDGMPVNQGFNSPIRMSPVVSGVEILQGGPSVVFGAGQFGVTMNIHLRTGTVKPSGEVSVTGYSPADGERVAGFYGFPITSEGSWVGSVGGFWQQTKGVRDPQYMGNRDYQFVATLKHNFSSGSMLFWGQFLKEHNEWIADYPIVEKSDGSFTSFPGFNALTGTVYSAASRFLPLQVGQCRSMGCSPPIYGFNSQRGRYDLARTFGFNFKWAPNDWFSLSNGFEYLNQSSGWDVFFNAGPPPQPLSAFVTQAEAHWSLPNTLTPIAEYRTGGVVPLNTLVMEQSPNHNVQNDSQVSDQLKLNFQLSQSNVLTVGTYLNFTSARNPFLGGFDMLETARNNPTPISLALKGNGHTYLVTDTSGVYTNWLPFFAANGHSRSHFNGYNVFASDTWRLDKWTVQLGDRYMRHNGGLTVYDSQIGDLDNNVYTLYNNTGLYPMKNPAFAFTGFEKGASQWSAGVNYLVKSNWSAYARYASAAILPGGPSQFGTPVRTQRIHIEEVGTKYQNPWLFLDISGYHRMFYNTPNGVAVAEHGVVTFLSGADALGINTQGRLGPFNGLSMRYVASYVSGHFTGHPACVPFVGIDGVQECVSPTGKRLQQQPKFQYRLIPTYSHATSWGRVRFWVNYVYLSSRFSDELETQPLGTMYRVDAGVQADVGHHWQITLRGRNITDSLGLNEGNARLFAGSTRSTGVIYGRAMAGHSYSLEVRYNFGNE